MSSGNIKIGIGNKQLWDCSGVVPWIQSVVATAIVTMAWIVTEIFVIVMIVSYSGG